MSVLGMDCAAPDAFFQGFSVYYLHCGKVRGQLNARVHCGIVHTWKLRLFG